MRHFAVSIVDWWQACVEAWTQVDGGMEIQCRRNSTVDSCRVAGGSAGVTSLWNAVAPWLCVPPFRKVCSGQRPCSSLLSRGAFSRSPRCNRATALGRGCAIFSTGGCRCMSDSRLHEFRAAVPGNALGVDAEVFSGGGGSPCRWGWHHLRLRGGWGTVLATRVETH